MTYLQAFLLSLLQGATEFLPVSSSGHLVIAQERFNIQGSENITFEIIVHVGTLLAIFIFFRSKIARLARFLLSEGWSLTRREGMRSAWLVDPRGRIITAVVLASIPTAVIGLLAKDFFENLYGMPEKVKWTGYCLCVTALLLASTYRRGKSQPGQELPNDTDLPFPLWIAPCVGLVQAMAIAPGISRSGSTIAVALLLGMSRPAAGEFSFLIAIPAILGATILKAPDILDSSQGLPPGLILFALAASAVSGYLFLRVLLGFVRKGVLAYFSLYCLALGLWAIFSS